MIPIDRLGTVCPFLRPQYNIFISYIDENRRAALLDVGDLGKHKVFLKMNRLSYKCGPIG